MSVEEQLRGYQATLDAATDAAASRTQRVVAMRRRRPARSLAIAAVAVAAAVAIAFAAVGATHRTSTPPAGVETSTTPTSTVSRITAVTTVVVPNVVGMRLADAKSLIDGVGLRTVTAHTNGSCSSAPGIVSAQYPAGGARTTTRQGVALITCTGPTARPPKTLPVVVCNTQYGVGPSASDPHAPTSLTVASPPFAEPLLSGYSDRRGYLPITAPAGWGCAAVEAADGGQAVGVTPPGVTPRDSWGSGATVTQPPTDGVFAAADPACQGCVFGEICGIVPSANRDFPDYARSGLCHAPPAGQRVTPLGHNLYAIDDPAGALGPDAAHSVLRYTPGTATTSASVIRETCILPPSQRAVCGTLLDEFLVLHPSAG